MTAVYTTVRHPHRGSLAKGGRPYLPAVDHPALADGRTIFPGTLKDPDEGGAILKSGHNNSKTGAMVTKGRWKGFPIFTLTLEERKTCPRSCLIWRGCMGNNMHLAERWQHGPELERYLINEVIALAKLHPAGFVVRLHILGDFYSVDYVHTWHALVAKVPALHVFGFTAHTDPESAITKEIARIRRAFPDRWWVRFSGADMATMATEIVDHPAAATPGFIVCPQQTQRTTACATCGLCWASNKSIAFLRH